MEIASLLHSIPPFNDILVAVSGGVDSMVLLDLLAKCRLDKKIRIIHINHNLQTVNKQWQDLIIKRCDELGLELIIEHIKIQKVSDKSLEEQARELRYKKFSQHLKANDLLMLAHHKNDQAETILFRLIKGGGLKGLSGIKKYVKYKHFFKLCPLLDISKEDILNYAKANNLVWLDDPSNQQDNFDRNFLRNTILPQLQLRWPGVIAAIARTGQICQASFTELEPLIQVNYASCCNVQQNTIRISKLQTFSGFMQAEIIRYWLTIKGYTSCSLEHLDILFTQVIGAKKDKSPVLNCGKFQFRRYRDNLFLLDSSQPNSAQFIIKYKNKGEKAKKIFQKYGIPPWERNKYPAIFDKEKLIAIVGIWQRSDIPPNL